LDVSQGYDTEALYQQVITAVRGPTDPDDPYLLGIRVLVALGRLTGYCASKCPPERRAFLRDLVVRSFDEALREATPNHVII
jgi:hypothetical protein